MDVADLYATRRARLRQLIDAQFGGSQVALAATLGRSAAQVNQWLSGHRSITEPSRDLIETKCALLAGWLDAASAGHAAGTSTAQAVGEAVRAPTLSEALPLVLDALAGLPPVRAASVRAQFDLLAASPELRDDVLTELQHLLQPAPGKPRGAA